MYMVVWRLPYGSEITRFRTYYRRAPAERALARELHRSPGSDFRVERISFWMRSAFWPTVYFWVVGAMIVTMIGLLVWMVLGFPGVDPSHLRHR